jgi:hypothetical protein
MALTGEFSDHGPFPATDHAMTESARMIFPSKPNQSRALTRSGQISSGGTDIDEDANHRKDHEP